MRRRCYHKSMVGHVAIAQQPDANVGITRILTIEPNLDTSRGYMTPEEDKELNDVNLFGMAEYLTPLAMNRDDQIRGSMMVKQSKIFAHLK